MKITPVQKPIFETGQIVATPGAIEAASWEHRLSCLSRHVGGDWGECDEEDKTTNDAAIKLGNRILSAYPLDPAKPCKGYGGNTLWIITEADRSVTTFLLPDEY